MPCRDNARALCADAAVAVPLRAANHERGGELRRRARPTLARLAAAIGGRSDCFITDPEWVEFQISVMKEKQHNVMINFNT